MGRILYHERKEHRERRPGSAPRVTDYVEVEVRSWTCEGMTGDVVIETRVMTDRVLTVDERWAYAHGEADAHFIRLGIAKFDKLLAEHPTL